MNLILPMKSPKVGSVTRHTPTPPDSYASGHKREQSLVSDAAVWLGNIGIRHSKRRTLQV